MIRARSSYSTGVAPPGCAVATSSTGYRITEPVVSTQAYMIRDIIQTPGGTTISLRLQQIPAVAPTRLVVRVDAGWHGLTRGQHPAESDVITVDGVPTHVPWTCAPGANLFTIELLGTTWVDESHFVEGHCYVPNTLIEASVAVNNLMKWCRAAGGPTTVQLPPGMMYVRDTAIQVPEGCTVTGGGMRVTAFFWADNAFQTAPKPLHVLESGSLPYPGTGGSWFGNVIGTTLENFSVYGNRSRQLYNSGTHALAFGYTDAEATFIPVTMTLRRIGVFGSSGYGIAMQGSTIKRDWIFDQVRNVGADNDGYDFKDRVDGNAHMRFLNCETYDWGLGNVGTNLAPLVRLPNNPITITVPSGDPSTLYFTLPRYGTATYGGLTGMGAGGVVTLSGVTDINGVSFNGTFRCVGNSVDGTTFTMLHTTPLTADTAGAGGSVADAFAPYVHGGTVAFDCRARHTTLSHCYAEGWLVGHNGFRQRPATRPAGNETGGSAMVMDSCVVRDTTPDWVASPSAGSSAFSIGEGDVTLISPTVWGNVGGVGIGISAGARGVQIIQPRIHNVTVGIGIAGADVVCTGGILEDCSLAGVSIGTSSQRLGTALDLNPFEPVGIGNSIVRVTDAAHGLSTGDIVGFFGVTNSLTNGLFVDTPVGANDGYPIVIVDADSYLIDLDRTNVSAALNTDPFGGISVRTRLPASTSEIAENIHFSDLLIMNTDPANTSIAWSIGPSGVGRVDDVTVVDCHNRGSAVPYIDYGDNTQWGPGNSGGVPNVPRTSKNTDFPCWEFIEEITLTEEATYIDLLNLDYPEIRVEIPAGKNNSTGVALLQPSTDNGRTFSTATGDIGRIGVVYELGGFSLLGAVADTTFAAVAELNQFNTSKRMHANVDGGQTYDAMGVQDPGSGGANPQSFFMRGPRALIYIGFGGNPAIAGPHQLTDMTIGGVSIIGSPVSYVTIAITAATWDSGTKIATFTTATPHPFAPVDYLYIQGMTPDAYDGFLRATVGTTGSTIVGYYDVTPFPEPPGAATGMGIVANPDATATAIAAEINTYMATLPVSQQLYTAAAFTLVGDATGGVLIRESGALPDALYGSTAKLPIVTTTIGDFGFDYRTQTAMGSVRFNALRLTMQSGILKAGTTIRVYQKGG